MVNKGFLSYTLILYCLLLLFSQFINAQSNKAEKEIRAVMKKYETVGVNVVVVKNNQLIYQHAFGFKNMETKEPLQLNDIFRIASISKSFTATSIMQLVEAGKLSLDDKVSDLIGFKIENPNFPDVPITLKMILSHTSSLNDKNGYFTLDVINPNKNAGWQNCYNAYAPGSTYQYCNLNYNLAGAILEKVSGEQFDKYVISHILQPLHLYGGYDVALLDSSRFVKLYEYNDSTKNYFSDCNQYASIEKRLVNYIPGYSTPVYSPTGGMKISAPDLAKYMMIHMNYGCYNGTRIIAEKSSKIMQTPLSQKSHYGLALAKMYELIPGKVMTGHSGDAYGLFSAMYFQPEDKFGFVVITNGSHVIYNENDQMNGFLQDVIRILHKRFIE